MFRLIGRRAGQRLITAGTDEVIAAYPIPAGGRLNNVWLEHHCMQSSEGSQYQWASAYGISGFVVPLLDPDATPSYQTLWDQLIPKDVAGGSAVFDIDTGAADTTPEWEVGEPDWTAVFNLASMNPVQIFRRRKFLSFANKGTGFRAVDAADDTWIPSDYFSTKVGRRVSVQTPSVVMFGMSSPSLDVTTVTEYTTPNEQQWVLLQYLEIALEQAFMYLVGLVEVGAETPYEESGNFIDGLIEESAYEENAGYFNPITWNAFTFATFDISVPGRFKVGTLTSEG